MLATPKAKPPGAPLAPPLRSFWWRKVRSYVAPVQSLLQSLGNHVLAASRTLLSAALLCGGPRKLTFCHQSLHLCLHSRRRLLICLRGTPSTRGMHEILQLRWRDFASDVTMRRRLQMRTAMPGARHCQALALSSQASTPCPNDAPTIIHNAFRGEVRKFGRQGDMHRRKRLLLNSCSALPGIVEKSTQSS